MRITTKKLADKLAELLEISSIDVESMIGTKNYEYFLEEDILGTSRVLLPKDIRKVRVDTYFTYEKNAKELNALDNRMTFLENELSIGNLQQANFDIVVARYNSLCSQLGLTRGYRRDIVQDLGTDPGKQKSHIVSLEDLQK